MILPSDGETPSGDDEDDPQTGGDKPGEEWWQDDGPDSGGDDLEDDEEEEDGDDEEEEPPLVKAAAGPGWRQRLKRELLGCIEDLKEIEDPDQDFDPPEPPDLYTFFGELAALRNETRQSGRRAAAGIEQTAGALQTVGEVLKNLPGGAVSGADAGVPSPWPPEMCLSLVALYDLVAEARPGEALEISFAVLLRAAGMERVSTEGKSFDGARMTITGVEITAGQPPGRVIRETEAGFLRAGVLLRPARVVITG